MSRLNAFVSYTHAKDEFNVVTALYARLKNELGMLAPDAKIFRDREQIRPGDRFPDELAQALDDTDVFIILLSPQWLTSTWCRWEYNRFTQKEDAQHLSPRLLPILWVHVDERDFSDDDTRRVAKVLTTILYDDWTTLRHSNFSDKEPSSRIAALAEQAKRLAARD